MTPTHPLHRSPKSQFTQQPLNPVSHCPGQLNPMTPLSNCNFPSGSNHQSSWHLMANSTISNLSKPISSPCPTYVFLETKRSYQLNVSAVSSNGRQAVGDGAFHVDAEPSVLAVCHVQGADDMYYYSTTFSGGPGVCTFHPIYSPIGST